MPTVLTSVRLLIIAALISAGRLYSCAPASACVQIDPFDSYGNISWEEEKAHLDNFAYELQHDPKLVGYIIVYAGRHACAGEAKAHFLRAGKYLTSVRRVAAKRINFIDGGYREEPGVTLQPARRGAPIIAAPTLKPSDVVIEDCGSKSIKRRRRS